MQRRLRHIIPSLWILCTATLFFVLWRGGKSLDSVWALGVLSIVLTLCDAYKRPTAASTRLPARYRCGIGLSLLYLVWTVVSFLLSSTRTYGFDEVIGSTSLVLLFLWTLFSSYDTRRLSYALARTLSVSLLIAIAAGLLVYMYQPVTRFVGTFFDARFHTDYWPNAWAEFVLLAWPLLLMVLLRTRRSEFLRCRRHDLLRALILGVTLGAFLLSYSRGAFIAFAGQCVLLLALFAWMRRGQLPWKHLAMCAVYTAVIGLTVFVYANHLRGSRFSVESVWQKATLTSSEGASSVSERGQFFAQSLALSIEKPLFGWGPYSFRFVQPRLQSSVLATSDHPHNVFLKLAMERGVVPALCFVLLLLCSVLSSLRSMRRVARTQWDDAIDPYLLTSVAGVIAHCLIDFNLQFVAIAVPLWIFLALLLRGETTPPTSSSTLRWTRLFFCASLFIIIAFEGSQLLFSSLARKAEAQSQAAHSLSLYAYTDASLFPRDAWLARAILHQEAKDFPAAEKAVQTSIALNPYDARSWRLLGDIYLAWGQREEAFRSYDKAFALGRWNDAGIAAGLAYLLLGRPALILERKADLEQTLAAFVTAIQHNTHFIALGQNVEDTVLLARRMARLFPSESERYGIMIDAVESAAKRERGRLTSRRPGLLW